MSEATTEKQTPTTNEEKNLNLLAEVVANAMTLRQEFFRRFTDPRRNIADECGFPRDFTAEKYRDLYEREAIAARVVQLMPKESWQVAPTVYEEEESDKATAFEEAWDALGRDLRGEQCWYQDEAGSPIWEHLRRADILSGIGSFGILLLGIDDEKSLDQPVDGVGYTGAAEDYQGQTPQGTDAQYFRGSIYTTPETQQPKPKATGGKPRRLLFLRAFDESLVQITQWESNEKSPRYGLPVSYLVTFNDPREAQTGIGLFTTTRQVHWTRVIHIADNLGSSEVAGSPRMRAVLNNLLSLQKLYGGSAEMYWRGAFPGLSFETNPQLGGNVNVDKAGLRDMAENYMNGLQRYLTLMGMTAKSLAPQVVDPSPQINVQIEAICIQLGCPVRVFKGSERGELASSQDDSAWNDRIRERQANHVTPRILIPFIDRLIAMGVLPEPGDSSRFKEGNSNKALNPLRNRLRMVRNADGSMTIKKGGYSIEWPDLDSLSEKDKSGIAVQKTQALAAYVSGNVESVIPPMEYLTSILGFSDEEAAAILEKAAQAIEQKDAEHGLEPVPPPQPIQPGNPETSVSVPVEAGK